MQLFIISLLALLLAAYATIAWQHTSHIHSFVLLTATREDLIYRMEGILLYLITHYEHNPELQARIERERSVVIPLSFWPVDHHSAMKAVIKQKDNERIIFSITVQKHRTVLTKEIEALVINENGYVRVVVL